MMDIDDFLVLVEPNAVNAPEPLVTRCIRDAAIRFCERTRLWRKNDSFDTDGEYPEKLGVPNDAVLFEIAKCSIDGEPLDPISVDDLADRRPDWRTEDVGSGAARWYVSPDFGTIQPVPRSSGTLTIEYILRPSAAAATLPDFLYSLYGQDIANGASGKVLVTPGQSFANPQLGAALTAMFESRLNTLSDAGRRGQQRARARSRGSFF